MQKEKNKKKYRTKRAIQCVVMRSITASDFAFSTDVQIITVKKKYNGTMYIKLDMSTYQ